MKTEQNQKTAWLRMARLGVVLMGMLPGVLYAENNTATVMDNVVSNFTGTYYVGNSGTNNTLDIVNAGVLTVSSAINVGYGALAAYNMARISGPGSTLNVLNSYLVCGSLGDSNAVLVEAGGTLKSLYGSIGHQAGADGNRVTITGASSLWTNSYSGVFYVGNVSAGNELVVSNQGACVINGGHVGYGATAVENHVLVTGANSVWKNVNTAIFSIGYRGRACALTVRDGGLVDFTAACTIGNQTGADDCRVMVADPNSKLQSLSDVVVGQDSTGNSLMVTNGGAVSCRQFMIGNGATSLRNVATVVGNGARVDTATGFGVYVGNSGPSNTLHVLSGGSVASGANLVIGNAINSTDNLLRVAGGTLMVTNAAGTKYIELRSGTLELDGTGGTVTANRLNIVIGQGVLRFRTSASGITPLTVTGAITINQSLASLVVDVRDLQLTSSPMVLTLVNYGSLNLPFTDVTVIGHRGTVTQTGGQITVKVMPIGTLLSIR